MTLLGDALKCVVLFNISCAALRLEGRPEPVTRSPQGWLVPKGKGKEPVAIMHIPKTAGTSFLGDAPKYLPKGVGLYAAEACNSEVHEAVHTHQIATMVRDPTGHVYSQYLEQADWMLSQPKQNAIPDNMKSWFSNVTHWLEFFAPGETSDPGAYHPSDMQSRSFVCSADQHHYSPVRLDHAVAQMNEMWFVGVTEYYQESMCIFFDRVQPGEALPKWCNCEKPEEWSQFQATRDDPNKVRPHSLEDLSNRDLDMIAALTTRDKVLYHEALSRFMNEVHDLEKRHNVKVFCHSTS